MCWLKNIPWILAKICRHPSVPASPRADPLLPGANSFAFTMHFSVFYSAILNCSCVSVSASLSANVSVSVSVSSIRIDGSAIVLVFQLSFNDSSLVSLKSISGRKADGVGKGGAKGWRGGGCGLLASLQLRVKNIIIATTVPPSAAREIRPIDRASHRERISECINHSWCERFAWFVNGSKCQAMLRLIPKADSSPSPSFIPSLSIYGCVFLFYLSLAKCQQQQNWDRNYIATISRLYRFVCLTI